MKTVKVERFETYFGGLHDSAVSCATAELEESIRRFVKRTGDDDEKSIGMSTREVCSMIFDGADELYAILGGDFSVVMTDEEMMKNHPVTCLNPGIDSSGFLFDMAPPDPTTTPAARCCMFIAKTIKYKLEHYVNNPSAWPTPGGFNQVVSDTIEEIVDYSRELEAKASRKP